MATHHPPVFPLFLLTPNLAALLDAHSFFPPSRYLASFPQGHPPLRPAPFVSPVSPSAGLTFPAHSSSRRQSKTFAFPQHHLGFRRAWLGKRRHAPPERGLTEAAGRRPVTSARESQQWAEPGRARGNWDNVPPWPPTPAVVGQAILVAPREADRLSSLSGRAAAGPATKIAGCRNLLPLRAR